MSTIPTMITHLTPGIGRVSGQPSGAAPPGGPWTPAALPGLRGWWVPDLLRQAEGSRVSLLPNFGGPYNPLAQTDAGLQPAYATVNGKGAMRFSAAGEYIMMGDASISNAASGLVMALLYQFTAIGTESQNKILMAVRTERGATNRMALLTSNTSGVAKTLGIGYRWEDNTGGVNAYSTTVVDLLPHVIVGQLLYGGAGAPKLDIWQDGVNILDNVPAFPPGNLAASDTNGSFIGCNPVGAAYSPQGYVIQALILRGSISTLDRQKVEGYLANFGGIQGQLPPAHPYFTNPPV